MDSRRSTGIVEIVVLAVASLVASGGCLAAGGMASAPVVVELFTSQGCSSCPPADAFLGELARRSDVIPLAFHVDYWDSSSWHDRFALPLAAGRQARYVAALRLSTAFTPQVVVNGRASYVGSDERSILAAISGANAGTQIKLEVAGDDVTVHLPPGPDHGPFEVNLIGYLAEASTAVKGGENTGRSLHEFNLVRAFQRLGSWEGQAKSFSIPRASLPADANRMAVVVQRPNQGYIVAAAASALR